MTDEQHDDKTQLRPGDGNSDPADQQPREPGAEPEQEREERTPNQEAAKWRRKVRDVEAERDGLAARVEKMQRAQVAGLVGDRLAVPDDLLAFGLQLTELLGEDGEVDAGLVKTAVAGLLSSRPGLAVARDQPRFPDLGGGRRGTTVDAGPRWAELLRQPR